MNKKEGLEILKQIYGFLKSEAKIRLQQNEISQFVDKGFRIKSDVYKEIYDGEILKIDNANVKNVKSKIKSRINRELEILGDDERINREINSLKGTIIELSKTIFSNELFNEKFIIVRSNIYNDYFNGIDEILVDKKTKTLLPQ